MTEMSKTVVNRKRRFERVRKVTGIVTCKRSNQFYFRKITSVHRKSLILLFLNAFPL